MRSTIHQLREATPEGKGPEHFTPDRDNSYEPLLLNVARSTGIMVLKTPVRAPKAKATCEHLIGSSIRECLNQILTLHTNRPRHIVRA